METQNPTPQQNPQPHLKPENKKIGAGLLALLLGPLGIHKFYLGYTSAGIIHIVISCIVAPAFTLLTCGCGAWIAIPGVYTIPFIEGIIYLTKSDEDFYNTYQFGQKQWV
jgi:TM2 domain-containing membrane protein YozV